EQLGRVVGGGVRDAEHLAHHEHAEQVVLVPLRAGEGAPVGADVELVQPLGQGAQAGRGRHRAEESSSGSSSAPSTSGGSVRARVSAIADSTITHTAAMRMMTSSTSSSQLPSAAYCPTCTSSA